MPIEVISGIIGFILTLMIFSYLIGDNPLFRIAIYLFIGVSSGYAAVIIWYYVLVPRFSPLMDDPTQLLLLIPLVLCFSILAKLTPRISWIGSFAMAVLVGVGAATAIGGALLGTLIPQARASMDALDLGATGGGAAALYKLADGAVMLVGTVLTLAYFHFSAKRAPDGSTKRNAILEILAWVGRIFIAITFGVLFAGVYMTALTAMIERMSFLIKTFSLLINFVKGLLGL
jgi:hypothetical protein